MFYEAGKRLLALAVLFLTDRLLSVFHHYLLCHITWSFAVGAQKAILATVPKSSDPAPVTCYPSIPVLH